MTVIELLLTSVTERVSVVSQLRVTGVTPSAGILHGYEPTKTWSIVGSDGKSEPWMYIIRPPRKDPERYVEGEERKVEAENICRDCTEAVSSSTARTAYSVFI